MSKYVYLIQNLETFKYKIGISKHPQKRVKEVQTGSGEDLELIHQFLSENPRKVETGLHNRFAHLHGRGEWFLLSLEDELNFINECERFEKNIKYLKGMGNEYI